MNYINTFFLIKICTKKLAIVYGVSFGLIAAKETAPKTRISGDRFFGEFPWEDLLDRERIAKTSDLWQIYKKQTQAELSALWNDIKRQGN